ncbi:hypothetical protein ACFUN7_26535 [Streptomyces sp. NPDC057236]|uniref:hypothetical protein n=1 Tax=Streptomyces sp. NPDC057236 TaxID=3346059 RepID=UPI003644E171
MESRRNGRRRALWRWGVGAWTAAVIVGGGLTLWLRDAAEPPPPIGWEDARPGPTPGLPSDWRTRCPPTGIPPGVEDGLVATACRHH